MKHLYLLSLFALLAVSVSAQTTLTDADLQNAYATKTYSKRLSCHDPSIVMDNIIDPSNPVYYVYGSHLGHGSTTTASNYQSWDDSWGAYEVTGTANSLFANASGTLINFADAYGNAHSWQYTGANVQGNQWAPDIIYNTTMKKWCLYESLNSDYWCSSIVLFTSDSPKGPWVNSGVVVYSGFSSKFKHNGYAAANDFRQTDVPKVLNLSATDKLPARYDIVGNGSNASPNWGEYWPNNIDPCVFYDDNNNLWMSYGSWSGGIFMLKLDPSTGLRDYNTTYTYQVNGVDATPGTPNKACTQDPYFGKKIAGGYYVSGEASYIQKIGNYYFLFMTYGGLNPSQGYQMRVFRSENPDGPYVDANGTSAIYSNWVQNYSFYNVSTKAASYGRDNRGVLLMEGYQWETMPKGEVAQGHNSAFIDAQGRAFVVYHTKFNDGTFGFQVRIHQLFLNEDGWLVAAPYEFAGETITNGDIASKASIADADIPGDYQFMRHQYGQVHTGAANDANTTTATLAKPVTIHLNQNGTVTGNNSSNSGTWTRKAGTDFITLTLNGVAYKGVLVKGTIDYTNISSLNIAAVSDDSGSNGTGAAQTKQQEIWASKADAKAAIKYTLDKMQIPFTDGATINRSATLPTDQHSLGTTVSWKSSDANVYDDDFGEPAANGPVTLTMTISKDGVSYSKEYSLTVDMNGKGSTPVYYPESASKDTTNAFFTNFSNYYTVKKGASAEFKFYNYSNKANNWDNWILAVTNSERGTTGYTEYLILRADNYGWGTCYDASGLSSEYNWDTFKDDMDGSLVDMTVDYASDGTFKMTSTITTTSGKVYNYGYTMTVTGAPSQLTLFFTGEKSYITGATTTGISSIESSKFKAQSSKAYNLNGQRVGGSYRGVVIKNGRKYVQK